ncbi:P-loop containing nucleoside triphosphate hydrolase protein [Lineolata rhizophorae]|uniref:ATP-dependent RNA helicase ROK1 n=1 Tax=Lineolata rhizophorae TaxID=578093 RepID=A0A6A6NTP3_9PEZI|nr:P-loop containing nucleoside triphosphate hydrolase protein [Lineolata rhizophorae]
MDAFKILSRSTKLSTNSPRKGSASKTPSSGQPNTPQLFGRDVATSAESASRKRKREGQGTASGKVADSVVPDLDIFPLAENFDNVPALGSGVAPQNEVTQPAGSSVTSVLLAPEEGGQELLSEGECKRLLRLHKLKVTLLQDAEITKSMRTQEAGMAKRTRSQLFPQPLVSFNQLESRYSLNSKLGANLRANGYTVPTEVQLGSLPLLLQSQPRRQHLNSPNMVPDDADKKGLHWDVDLLAVAPTGSGKTLAFLIPVVNALAKERSPPLHMLREETGKGGPVAVVVAPTKELANQIVNEARKLALGTSLRISRLRKGQRISAPRAEDNTDGGCEVSSEESNVSFGGNTACAARSNLCKKGAKKQPILKADVLVSTPLLLLSAIESGPNNTSPLSTVRHLILDEADVLLDPLFREQTLKIWYSCTHPLLRVRLWSATMGSSIEEIALTTINDRWNRLPSTAKKSVQQPPVVRLVVGLKDTAVPNVAHALTYAATEQGKLIAVRQMLHPTMPSAGTGPVLRPPFLIFTQTIQRAIALHAELLYDIPAEAGGRARIAVLHAELSDTTRDEIMTRFRLGEIWVLITTDLLARGVDFRGVNGVVNYDVPNSAAAYVHRVGRTARAGREGGVAVTLYTKEDIPYVKNVANVIAASQKSRGACEGELHGIERWLLDSLPTPSKRDKQRLKKRGVEARRPDHYGKNASKTRISTKSGFERRIESNRKGAIRGTKNRTQHDRRSGQDLSSADDTDFVGFDD